MKVFFSFKPQKGYIKSPSLPLNMKGCQKLPLQWSQIQPGSHKDSHRSTHTEQKVYSFFLCSLDSGWQGEAVFLHESRQSGNRAGLGPQQCYGRVSAYGFILCVFMCLHRCVCVVNVSVCVYRQDSRRRKQFRDQTSNRITLEAVLNTTCSKCGCKGEVTSWVVWCVKETVLVSHRWLICLNSHRGS